MHYRQSPPSQTRKANAGGDCGSGNVHRPFFLCRKTAAKPLFDETENKKIKNG